jgi:enoyl-CoA hydratase
MDYETILSRRDGAVLYVTLNRPKVHNAINKTMLREIREAVQTAVDDPKLRVVCLGAAGGKAFSAGIDVAYVKDLDGYGTREVGRELHRTFLALRTQEIPIVCAIDGLCLGAGLEMALSCDFMVATDRSTFGLPNIHRGIPAIVEAAILPIAIGIQAARELCYLGTYWDSAKALQRGLIHRSVPVDAFAREVAALCDDLAAKSPQAIGTQKEIVHKWMTTDMESAIDFSINTVVLNWLTPDQKEGMGSFLEKRKAEFKGGTR